MKIGILGGRKFDKDTLVEQCIDSAIGPLEDDGRLITFLGGGSKGAERTAERHVTGNLCLDYVTFVPFNFLANNIPHHPRYFFLRNKQIIDNSDMVLIFNDGEENAIQKSIEYVQKETSKDYRIFYPDGTMESREIFTESTRNVLP